MENPSRKQAQFVCFSAGRKFLAPPVTRNPNREKIKAVA